MLPSPIASGLGLLDPHGLISRRGSLRLMLRPAAPFLLALPPGSRPTAEDSLPSSSGGLPGWDFHPRLTSPCWTHMPLHQGSRRRASGLGASTREAPTSSTTRPSP